MNLLTSAKLSQFKDLKIFMTTKIGGVSPPPFLFNLSFNVNDKYDNVAQNRKLFFNYINVDDMNIVVPKQTHSDNVKIVSKPGNYSDCDALITRKRNLFLTVTVADCIPIFLYDNVTKIIGIVHAGWQGSAKKIIAKTIDSMNKQSGAKPQNIFAFIGPAASVCCYEVGSDVSKLFDNDVLIPKDDGKFFLDLKKSNLLQLLNLGVPENNIEVSEFCTICNSDTFHSYRRDGKESGRMMGIIGMVN